MTSRLKGVLAAIPTPIDAAGAPDDQAFIRVARHLLDQGCDGLNVLGTTGEATSFSLAQRMALMSAVAASGLPLQRMMVGTGAAAVDDAAVLTRHAATCGFAGALLLPPFYYKGIADDGVADYIDAVIAASADPSIPIYLYHFPALSGVPYGLDLIRRLLATHPQRIVGLKDSSGDLAYARAAAALSNDFDVFPSNEATLFDARAGVFAGCISATANLTSVDCARAFHHGDADALKRAADLRASFDGKPLVPAVKAMLAERLGEPGLRRVKPPLVAA